MAKSKRRQAKNAAAVLGRLGGSKGGRKSAANLTPMERKERARKAALARWKRVKRSS